MVSPILMPVPKQQFFNNAGLPLVGGKVYTYAAGTLVNKATFTDAAGTIPQANPIILNARGEPDNMIYWSGVYDIVITDFLGNLIYTVAGYSTDPAGLQGILPLLQSAAGASKIGFTVGGAGSVLMDLDEVLKGLFITPEDFGATGASAFPGDTVAVQAALDDGRPVRFIRDYYVDTIVIGGIGRTVDFNGYGLIGCAGYGPDYLLAITGRELVLNKVKVNANFLAYGSAIRWHSLSAGAPAQYNKVYGMHIAYATNGLTFGQQIGTPSVDAAQSENVIYSLTFRGVRNCFTGNQSNGFLTLVNPVLDCNPYEWSTQPGYDVTAYQTAARCFNNALCVLVIVGGEILKTSTQLGYGFEGKGFITLGAQYEIGCAWGFLTGGATIKDGGGYMASDSKSVFVISAAAPTGSQLLLDNFTVKRGAGVGSYSGAVMIDSSANQAFTPTLTNCSIDEWKANYLVSGCKYKLDNVYLSLLNDYLSTTGRNILRADPYGGDVPAGGGACEAWTISNIYGGGAPTVKSVATTALRGCTSAIEFTPSGGATDFFSRFARVPAGRHLLVNARTLRTSGGGTARMNVSFYGADRVLIGATSSTVLSPSTTVPGLFNSLFIIPAGACWVRIEPNQDLSTVMWISDLSAVVLGRDFSDNGQIYANAAPTTGVWMRGETVRMIDPVAAGYSGYVCVLGGSPGTWKGFGLIQA